MILNISGRTDIIAFYSNWFQKRYTEGFVDVRNPFNPNLVSRIYFDDVDAILFCTKNPEPIITFLPKIKQPIIFHVTLTPYKNDIEPYVPSKIKVIENIKKLSKILGKERIIIRYDPIFFSEKYDHKYHQKAFEKLCSLLDGYVEKIIISFLDEYKNVKKNQNILKTQPFTQKDYEFLGIVFSKIALQHHMTIQTCFEEKTLIEYGFIKGECFSKELAFQLTGKTFKKWTARKEGKCECVQMVDIGSYNTCSHFCKYCYANFDEKMVQKNTSLHDENSSLLIGHIKETDQIKVRK